LFSGVASNQSSKNLSLQSVRDREREEMEDRVIVMEMVKLVSVSWLERKQVSQI
jgi:hypothetical protein